MKKIKLWLTVIIASLAGYVAWHNNQPVVLEAPWPLKNSFETTSVIVYISFFILGFLLAALFFGLTIFRLKMQIRKLNKDIAQRAIAQRDAAEAAASQPSNLL